MCLLINRGAFVLIPCLLVRTFQRRQGENYELEELMRTTVAKSSRLWIG